METKPTEDEITDMLKKEIGIITGSGTVVDADRSLTENGINSMGFMELLVAVENRWHVSLIDKGLTAREISSVRTLARFIGKGLENE